MKHLITAIHKGGIHSLAISSDSSLLATGGDNNVIHIWRLPELTIITTLPVHPSPQVNSSSTVSLAFTQDGNYLVSGHSDGTVALWQLSDWKKLRTLRKRHKWLNTICVSQDQRYLFTAGMDNQRDHSLRMWKFPEGKSILTLLKRDKSGIAFLAMKPDGSMLASGGSEGIELWSVPYGKHLKTIRPFLMDYFAISPDWRLLAFIPYWFREIYLYTLPEGDFVNILRPIPTDIASSLMLSFSSNSSCVGFSRGGELLASGGANHVQIWDMPAGKQLELLHLMNFNVTDLSFAPSKNLLVCGIISNLEHVHDHKIEVYEY
jgi:WD40 repeat protein